MAEHFYGKNHIVHTSNKGSEELLKGLIEISYKLEQTLSLIEVRNFLKTQLKCSCGWKAFSLNPNIDYPPVLEKTHNLMILMNVIKGFGYELSKKEPQLDVDIEWSKDLRCKWLAKIMELHEIIRQLLADREKHINKLSYSLDNDCYNLCTYYLTTDYYYELCRRNKKEVLKKECQNKTNKLKLTYLNKIISTIEEGLLGKDVLLNYLWERIELLVLMKDKEKAVIDLKKSFSLEEDENGKEIVLSYLKQLNKDS